jgi:hypothetical protein
MTNFTFTIYGGYDQIVSAFTMMALIFHDSRYTGFFATIMTLGIVIPGLIFFAKTLMSGGQSGTGIAAVTTWFLPALLGIITFMVVIRPQANLQVFDPTTGQSQAISMPLGIAMSAGLLNGIENELVNIISSSGDVNSPNDYRKYSGGSGFDVLTKSMEHRDTKLTRTMQAYYQDCVLPNMQLPGSGFDQDDFRFGTGVGGGFWTQMAIGSDALLQTTDYTGTAGQSSTYIDSGGSGTNVPTSSLDPLAAIPTTCDMVWPVVMQGFENNANWVADVDALCTQSGYNVATNAQAGALCREKISTILSAEGGKNGQSMTPETFVAMKNAAEYSMSSLNGSDPAAVTEQFAGKTLAAQGQGIGLVVTKYAPIIRSIMWCIVIGLCPILILFMPTPLFGKVLGLIFGLMIWLTCWTVSDCLIHTSMQYYISSNFSPLQTMGNGALWYTQMPSAASEAVSMYGYAKGLSVTIATIIAGVFGFSGSFAMSQLAGSMQGHLQSAGQQAGAVAFTPEGRASAIDAQHNVATSMTNAHKYNPSQMFEKGNINAQNSMGAAQGSAAALTEAIAKGQLAPGSSQTDYAKMMSFKGAQNQIGGFKSQQNGMDAAKAQHLFPQNGNLTDWAQASGNSNQHFTGTDGKVHTAAVDANGNTVWSETKAGHSASQASSNINAPTTTMAKNSLGAVSANMKEEKKHAEDTIIGNSHTQTTRAADNWSNSRSALKTEEDSQAAEVRSGMTVGSDKRKAFDQAYSARWNVSDQQTDALAKTSGVSKEKARTYLSALQGEINAHANFGGTIPLTEIGAGVGTRLVASGAINDQDAIRLSEGASKTNTAQRMESVAKESSHTLTTHSGQSVNHTNGTGESGSDSLRAASNNTISAGDTLAHDYAAEQSVRQQVHASNSNSVDINEDLSGAVVAKLHGMKHADGMTGEQAMEVYNNPQAHNGKEMGEAREMVIGAVRGVVNDYGSEIIAKADSVAAEGDKRIAAVNAHIAGTEALVQDPKAAFNGFKKEVDAERQDHHVEAGHQPQTPSLTMTDQDKKGIDQFATEHKPADTAAYKQENEKLRQVFNNQNKAGLVLPAAATRLVATAISPELGGKIDNVLGGGVNKVLGAAKSFAAHPIDTATQAIHDSGALPIAFKDQRAAVGDSLPKVVSEMESGKGHADKRLKDMGLGD